MKKLEVRFTRTIGDESVVGFLAEARNRVYFEYAPEFLATGLNLSPFRLPFATGLFEHTDFRFGPLPGLFDDSLPDGWGLLLMDRHFRASGMNPDSFSALDRLAWLGTRTMGALTYHPSALQPEVAPETFDLHRLARHAEDVLHGETVEVLPQLLRAGGSPGGARPKVLVGFDPARDQIIAGDNDQLPAGFEPWIIKFAARYGDTDAGAIEYAYSLMAAAAGIDLPPTRLFVTREGDRFFGCLRFDRHLNRRFHVHTFGNLIQANFRIPSVDYRDLLKATSLLTRDHRQVAQAFRRMVFNVLAHNRDDHVKNFAFIMDDTSAEWQLTPAYDLVFAAGAGGEHTMTLAGEGRNPGREQMRKLADEAGLDEKEAADIREQVREAVAGWHAHADRAGVSRAGRERIAAALGFAQS
ncbi:type II toxin-antitoxin system HipA family toxin [Desulfurivibrio sp. D14AmB]|uniref:type II toxin-antitoxin system HipA family toxin n=1 Tax=Desulfurivibrio sp. D14AmB TaxID=3374370 RepID=UPI00376EAD06